MQVYVKYDPVTNKVLRSISQPDNTWVPVTLTSLSDVVEYDPNTNNYIVYSAKDYLVKVITIAIYKATEKFIYSYYPEQKQDSDVADKEIFSRWLNDVRTDLTLSDIDAIIYKDAYDILFGVRTFEEVVSSYPTTLHKYFDTQLPENVGWVQLLKVSLRVSWVQQVKLLSHKAADSLPSLTIEQLKSYNVSDVISTYPPLPDFLR